MYEVLRYVTSNGKAVISEWLAGLADPKAKARIAARFLRLATGNFGDCRPVGGGVWEMRIDHGPGYRIYYAMAGRACVLLLCGGDKRKQAADIASAKECWDDYRRRIGEL